MSDIGPDRRSIVRHLAALDRETFHPNVYDDLATEGEE